MSFKEHLTLKEKIGKFVLKLRTSVHQRTFVKKVKRQVTKWEKIFAAHLKGKGFISRIY